MKKNKIILQNMNAKKARTQAEINAKTKQVGQLFWIIKLIKQEVKKGNFYLRYQHHLNYPEVSTLQTLGYKVEKICEQNYWVISWSHKEEETHTVENKTHLKKGWRPYKLPGQESWVIVNNINDNIIANNINFSMDANLIAVAPDLYEVCKDLVRYNDSRSISASSYGNCIKAAREAIAKVESTK